MSLKIFVFCVIIGAILLPASGAPTESTEQSHSNESKSHQDESAISHEESDSAESEYQDGEDKSMSTGPRARTPQRAQRSTPQPENKEGSRACCTTSDN